MDALTQALDRSRSIITAAQSQQLEKMAAGIDLISTTDANTITTAMGGSRRGDSYRYSLNRGWLYAAINAIASEAAGQDLNVGRMKNAEPNEQAGARLMLTKTQRNKMPRQIQSKAADQEVEIIPDHPICDLFDHPNPVQGQWQFIYNFVANLNLTGWSFIVAGENDEGELELFSLPTTWVRPIHKDGPFSHFDVGNPKNPQNLDDKNLLTRDQVAFAHLPDPSDPLAAMAPVQSQVSAIRIDDHIQTSQERFFQNGIFPSVIITIGKEPHPDIAGGGSRPMLAPEQRRQVIGAVRKAMSGVASYGDPAIVDGMIERIDRLSASENEMGWEKSEEATRRRILSSFGVHPYILGEAVNIGGYAQAAKIEERFCKRVNIFVSMLSRLATTFVGPMFDPDERTLIWLEECFASDPSLHWLNLREGRKNNDVSKNEYRTELGLPPDEDDPGTRGKLLDNPAGMSGATNLIKSVTEGHVPATTAIWLLSQFLTIPIEDIEAGLSDLIELAAKKEEERQERVDALPVVGPPIPPNEQPPPDNGEPMEEELRRGMAALRIDPQDLAEAIVRASR